MVVSMLMVMEMTCSLVYVVVDHIDIGGEG